MSRRPSCAVRGGRVLGLLARLVTPRVVVQSQLPARSADRRSQVRPSCPVCQSCCQRSFAGLLAAALCKSSSQKVAAGVAMDETSPITGLLWMSPSHLQGCFGEPFLHSVAFASEY
eukprot:350247-Chlamydomonas_euryale.AAC.1